ncbi:hypothetical protein F5Y00DRAFT_265795 [Daldinia vernicosa]|uniref:uncharacterized protein n=1 Tax=Daldinia vernicosa TaxID=114800 RepID=UPI0020073D5D|nr:uncharacterized protein F5Y00DRAFT_265795 [Daldinia vernicosa]KAI0845264.1 hypothetical protein F5Y00DRAFT_265795 [Daldinia vernicosa]
MECNVDPLDLHNPHSNTNIPAPPKPDMEFATREFDFLDNFHVLGWGISISEIIGRNSGFNQFDLAANDPAKPSGHRLAPLKNSLTTKPPGRHQIAQPSHFPTRRRVRGVEDLEDVGDNVDVNFIQKGKRGHRQSKLIQSNLPSSLLDDDFGVRNTQKLA